MLPSVVLSVSLFLIPFLRYIWTLYQLACPPEPDSWPLYHAQASLHVFVCVCCSLLDSIDIMASREICCATLPRWTSHVFLNSYRGISTQSKRPGNLRMTRWNSPGFQRIVRTTKNGEWSFRRSPLLRLHEIFVGTDPRTFMIFKMWAHRSVSSHSWWPFADLSFLKRLPLNHFQ